MSGTGIHRLIYRDICVERGASYAACAAHNTMYGCTDLSAEKEGATNEVKHKFRAKLKLRGKYPKRLTG